MKKKQGFSLIELLIFTTILSLVFISVSTIITASLANLKKQEHKILATHFAEELLEWLRAEKEADWNSFVNKNGTYCFNANPIPNSWPFSIPCSDFDLNSIFKREAQLSSSTSQKNITITVKWLETNGENRVTIKAVFNPWEE
jgi:type II secretory pathway pseudopilin PulG